MSTAVAQTGCTLTSDTTGKWVGGGGTGGRPASNDTIDLNGETVTLDTNLTNCTLTDTAVVKGSLTVNGSTNRPDGWTISAGATMLVTATCSWTAAGHNTINGTLTCTALYNPSGKNVTVGAGGVVNLNALGKIWATTFNVYGTVNQVTNNAGSFFTNINVYSGGVVNSVGAYGGTPSGCTNLTVYTGGTMYFNAAWSATTAILQSGSILYVNNVRVYSTGAARLVGAAMAS
jgi:hypothetical protein